MTQPLDYTEHTEQTMDNPPDHECLDYWHDCTCSYPGQFKSSCPYTTWTSGKRCQVCKDRRAAANAFQEVEGG